MSGTASSDWENPGRLPMGGVPKEQWLSFTSVLCFLQRRTAIKSRGCYSIPLEFDVCKVGGS